MPYIKEEFRKLIKPSLERAAENINTCGDLNYAFTILAHKYLEKNGLRYQTINDVLGSLDGASKEFYRRIAESYEDQKIKENGDVTPSIKI